MQVILLVIKFSDNTDKFHCAIQLSCVSQWWKHMNVFLWFHENRHSSRMHYVDIRLWYVTTVLCNCDGCICSDAKYAPGYQHHHAVYSVTCIILRSMHVALQWLNKPCLSRKSISVFVLVRRNNNVLWYIYIRHKGCDIFVYHNNYSIRY